MEQGFIAYVGAELDEKYIRKLLAKITVNETEEEDENFKPRIRKSEGAIFGQAIQSDYDLENELPYVYKNDLLYVARYDYDNLKSVCEYFEGEYKELDSEKYHELIPILLEDYDEVAFKLLEKKGLNYGFASFNQKTRQLTVAKMNNCDLFYGYTKQNHEIIFSDYEEIIQEVCGSVYKFPDRSFYIDGAFQKKFII